MAAEASSFSGRRLFLAVLLGVGLQAVMLAFGLHASLAIGGVSGDSLGLYWILNGVYLVAGLAFGQLLIPWAKLSTRAVVCSALLGIGLCIGLLAIPAGLE